MAIQFEHCVDCLKVLFPQFDFVFMFDHSQGHAKQLANGLDAYSMNKGYGGQQPKMHELIIKREDGYLLGMYAHTLNVGDTQSFVFDGDDDGPFWMTNAERELKPPRSSSTTTSRFSSCRKNKKQDYIRVEK